MSSFTPNINLMLTPENDTTTTFKEWRVAINGENDNSNMSKIDKAIGSLNKSCSELTDKVNAAFDKSFSEINTWKDVQAIVRNGLAAQYFNIGDQFVVEKLTGATTSKGTSTGVTAVTVDANKFVQGVGETKAGDYVFTYDNRYWHDDKGKAVKLEDYGITVTGTPKANDAVTITETTTPLAFDVIGIDHDIPTDKNYTHSMTLQLHDLWTDTVQYDAQEAAFYIDKATYPSGLAAGTYNFVRSSTTYQFTLTQAVPAGGQICVNGTSWTQAITYSSATSTTPIETVSITTGSSGTSLGTFASSTGTNILNTTDRVGYGSNNWEASAMRQWLNTDGDANTWWVPKSGFDRPGTTAQKDGFLKNIDAAFLDVIGDVDKTTQKSTADGYGMATSTERFFLLSRPEVYAGTERSTDGADGTVYPYYGAGYSALSAPGIGSDANRIKYRNGSATIWWLRTPVASTSYGVRSIYSAGDLSSGYAYNSCYAAPACVII